MEIDFKDIILFGKKNFSDILKEIHTNHTNKEQELKQLINDLKPLITTPGEAMIVVPLIKGYIAEAVKNDDNLIKMATIVQKAINTGKQSDNGDLQLSDDEKEQLLNSVQKLSVV